MGGDAAGEQNRGSSEVAHSRCVTTQWAASNLNLLTTSCRVTVYFRTRIALPSAYDCTVLCVHSHANMSRLSICAITDDKQFRGVDASILARMLQHNTVLTTLDLSGMCEALHAVRV